YWLMVIFFSIIVLPFPFFVSCWLLSNFLYRAFFGTRSRLVASSLVCMSFFLFFSYLFCISLFSILFPNLSISRLLFCFQLRVVSNIDIRIQRGSSWIHEFLPSF